MRLSFQVGDPDVEFLGLTSTPHNGTVPAAGPRDLVWELARDDNGARRRHLEFPSRRDAEMSERMFLHALHISPSLRGLEICEVVVNTGVDVCRPGLGG